MVPSSPRLPLSGIHDEDVDSGLGTNPREDVRLEDDLLLRCIQHNNGIDKFWSFDVLSRILTRDRIVDILHNTLHDEEAKQCADCINPVYNNAEEASRVDLIFPSPKPKRFIKIFALLVYMGQEKYIKDFIEYDISDNDLPLHRLETPKATRLVVRGEDDRNPIPLFRDWRLFMIESFCSMQYRFSVPFFEMDSRCGTVMHYDLPPTTILPWRRDDTDVERLQEEMGGYGSVVRVEIDAGSHGFHQRLQEVLLLNWAKKDPGLIKSFLDVAFKKVLCCKDSSYKRWPRLSKRGFGPQNNQRTRPPSPDHSLGDVRIPRPISYNLPLCRVQSFQVLDETPRST